MFSLEQRVEMIHRLTESEPNISVSTYQGLTVSFAKEKGADFLIRGLRSAPDFEFERNIAQLNMKIAGIETVFLITDPALSPISSSLVREIYRNGGDVGSLIPEGVTLPPLSS
jgi:pantetheine-phosphate adenylyltransferase